MRTLRLFTSIPAIVLGIVLGVIITPAFAQVDDGAFELGDGSGTVGSGDIEGSETQDGPDWEDIFEFDIYGNLTVNLNGGLAATFSRDDLSAKGLVDDTTFASSNKNNYLIGDWHWDTGNNPPKDDQVTAYVYAVMVDDHLRIYGGQERIASEGDSHVDIEFNQNTIGLDKEPPCGDDGVSPPTPDDGAPCEFTGEKTVDDIVVSMDFTKGGDLGTLSIHRWNGAAFELVATLAGESCNSTGSVCAFNNAAPVGGGSWDHFGRGGALITDIPHNGFTEFGVDVTEVLDTTVSPCYGTVNFKTRSSQSFTSELKDFSLHPFEECNATVSTEVWTLESTPRKVADDSGFTMSVPGYTWVEDRATVTGVEGLPPTGTVKFWLHASACTDSVPTLHDEQSLSGLSHTETVISASYEVMPGTVGFKAWYSGDGNYPEAWSGCETFTVNRFNSAVNTAVLDGNPTGTDVTNKSIDTSTSPVLYDRAVVTGSGGIDPTGDVEFWRYPNADCDTADTPVISTVTLVFDGTDDGTATAYSPAFTPVAGEFYCWQVFYSGDNYYEPSSSVIGEPICAFEFDPSLE